MDGGEGSRGGADSAGFLGRILLKKRQKGGGGGEKTSGFGIWDFPVFICRVLPVDLLKTLKFLH